MFCADIIGPLEKRVMHALGIQEGQIRGKQVLGITEEFIFDVDEKTGVGNVWIDDQGLVLEHGKTYEVLVDGQSYRCQAIKDRNLYLLGSVGESYSDYPFYINSDKDTIDLYVKGTENTHTVDIYEVNETIHPISDKYLPGVCLPVVELETVVANEVMLSEADVAKLEKVIGFPIVLKMTNQAGEKMATLANYFADGAANAFITTGDASYIFMDEAGTGEWAIITNG